MHARGRFLVACVGNPLRVDDGFGYVVAGRLTRLPADVEVVETGIGGIALLQEIMRGWDGLIVVDAVERDAAPGTVFVIEPQIGEPSGSPDMHLADPDQVLALAKAMDRLPARVLLVGCQPADVEGIGERLTPAVERAVAVAVEQIEHVLERWTTGGNADP